MIVDSLRACADDRRHIARLGQWVWVGMERLMVLDRL
jgi:hypothetical protein